MPDNTYCHYSDLPSPLAYMEESEKESRKQNEIGKLLKQLTAAEINRIIEMAWEDRTPFDAISFQFGISEEQVKQLMKKELRFSSYKLWRKRVEACKTKHSAKRVEDICRFKCNRQRSISRNKISKRRFRSI